MEKEPRKHNAMESLLPTKILRNSASSQARNVRPKSCEYSELCNQIIYNAAFGKLVPPRREPEELDNDWDELIGHPVCISGVKQGILRYYGRTKFADGLWCGVELDEPVGKNDGMVNGIRYFYCKPNRGIFAPVTKVSLLPLASSKRHGVIGSCGDQNFYRKQEGVSHPSPPKEVLDDHYISTGGDSAFQSNNCNRFCSECSEKCRCDRKPQAEQPQQQQQVVVDECRGCFKSKFSPKGIDSNITLPLNSNNTEVDAFNPDRHKRIQHTQVSRLTGSAQDRKQALLTDYMSFPRKVMSDYSLNERENKVSLKPSRSYPYATGHGMKGLEAESYFHALKGTVSMKQDAAHAFGLRAAKQEISKGYNPSLEFLDNTTATQDDEDQLSLDYDESLGILTPSEMKDFTLCADLPTSYSDTRALDFPSSESFDDVNDLPEDEQVHEPAAMMTMQQYIPSSSSSSSVFIRSAEPCSQQQQQNSYMTLHEIQQRVSATQSHVVTNTDRFFSSISSGKVREVHLTSTDYATCCPRPDLVTSSPEDAGIQVVTGSCDCRDQMPVAASPYDEDDQPEHIRNLNFFPRDVAEKQHLPSVFQKQKEYAEMMMMVAASGDKTVDSHQPKSPTEEASRKPFYDTEISRDSLLPEQDPAAAVKEKLTVSWEDCIAECTEDMYNRVERPESVYTVGSNDTGYQEDGEFDTGMTTSMESSEDYKRFSMASRDSCIPPEDLEIDKVAESTSTSGYSTGLSDSCCNDRREDGCRNMMDDSFHDVPDPCNSDDAQDVAFEGLNSEISEKVDGFFDMDSCKDNESTSEFHITESSTVLGLDSTSDTLCETVIVGGDEGSSPIETKADKGAAKQHQTSSGTTGDTFGQVPNKTANPPTTAQKQNPLPLAKKSPERKATKAEKVCSTTNSKKSSAVSTTKENKAEPKSPKRNVMSKLKAVIGGGSSKPPSSKTSKTDSNKEQTAGPKKPAVPKKSRWEAVTSKIAASLAEEKTKPKVKKDVKSRVDTNLSSAKLCRSPKLDSSSASDHKADISIGSSGSSKSGRTDRFRNLKRGGRDSKQQSMQVAGIDPDSRSPRPCKTCSSSRSTSPIAASESSTSVSYTSHQSRSKIAIWKGSNSTVASSVPPAQKPKSQEKPTLRSATTTSRLQSRDSSRGSVAGKLRSACAKAASTSTPVISPKSSTAPTLKSVRLKSTKEQGNAQRPLIAPRPVRPPMWLSKAELTQEIQHLTNLCETRTKELNRLKMEARKVSTGFDALAVVINFMNSDLKAFDNPSLAAEVKELQSKLVEAKEELAHYKNEVEDLNSSHVKEMELLSEKMQKEHNDIVEKVTIKHEAKMLKLKEKHDIEVKSMTDALRASCEEEKLQNARMVDDLKKELLKQREEMEIFHQHELDDLEERYMEKQNSLTAEIEKLQKKCEDAQLLSNNMEEALQKDTDSKLQWLTSKRQDLQNEVDSLKAVLEIKNNELHSLRKENLGMQKELEELHVSREKIKMLQARAEDLQALMNEKVRIERQLSNEHQVMKETYEREAKINRRLSMENEELLWRLKQVSETSLMTVPLPDEPETNEADASTEVSSSCVPETFEEEAVAPLSPAKSPRPPSATRPVFFTYMNEEELSSLSPGSPRTQYKRIQPSCKSQSPARQQFKSPSRPSPRRSRGSSSDLSPQSRGDTPRKMAKRSNSLRDAPNQFKTAEGSKEKIQNGNITSTNLIVTDSLVSSASSENSVFEHCLFEEQNEEMCISLKMLEEHRTADFILDVSSLSCNSQGEWVSEPADAGSSSRDVESCIVDPEYIDPKSYYHMTFPVKDSVQDVDAADDLRREANDTKSESLQGVCDGRLSLIE